MHGEANGTYVLTLSFYLHSPTASEVADHLHGTSTVLPTHEVPRMTLQG